MENWLEKAEVLTLKGRISVPYTWWVGETGSHFLNTIRNEAKILGSRCASCGTVFVPPRKNCGRCFTLTKELTECGPDGVVTAFTIVRKGHGMHPEKVPFAHVLVRLDRADVDISHLVTEDLDKLSVGARVKAVFREPSERCADILDIKGFQFI